MNQKQKGFSLIELLIVLMILVILLAAILFIVNPLKKRDQARDAQRWSEVITIAVAIKSYTAEHWGDLPDCGENGNIPDDDTWRCIGTDCLDNTIESCNLKPDLVPDYLPEIPHDPTDSNDDDSGYYIKRAPSQTPVIWAPYASEYAEEDIMIEE